MSARGRVHARAAWIELIDVARYVAGSDADVVEALPKPSVSHATVADGYARSVLPLLLQLRGHLCLHASGVVTERGVVAFAGVSGAGKSTLAAAVARRGYPQWADDAVALSFQSGSLCAVPLPFAPRFTGNGEQLVSSVPSLPQRVRRVADQPERMLAVFVLERSTTDEPGVTRLDAGPALQAVVENSYCFSVEALSDRRRFFDNQLGLVAGTTAFRAELRAEPDQFPRLVEMITASIESLPDRSS